MAFKMTPGRSPLQQTGRGIPSAFLQTRTTTTVNPVSGNTTKEQAAAEAKKKAEEKLAESIKNKPLVGTETRNTEGSASYTTPGKKVERFATTPAEIAAWKKAPEENKKKYEDVVTEVKGTASGQGKIDEIKEKDYGSWYKSTVDQNFGGGGSWGSTMDKEFIKAGEKQNAYDTSRGNQIAPGSNPAGNLFKYQKITEQENRLGPTASPYDTRWSDYGADRTANNPDSRIDTSPGSGEKRRQEYIKSTTEKLDKKAAEEKARQDAVKAKHAAARAELKAKNDAKAADREAKKAAVAAALKAKRDAIAAKNTPLNQKASMAAKGYKKAPAKTKKR